MIIEVTSRNQITLPQVVREKLRIKAGDRLLVDFQDGVMILIPEPGSYSDTLSGLHSEIWNGVDAQKYVDRERGAWIKMMP